nr:DUF6017 domain-containing protein [Butyrivibrio sp. FC2001]
MGESGTFSIIKSYLLPALFNAPTTMSSYYQSEVSHDLACGVV